MKTISKVASIVRFGAILIQAIAVAAAIIETYKKLNPKAPDHDEKSEPDMSHKFPDDKDLVDEASWESFPASDPPSWNRAKA